VEDDKTSEQILAEVADEATTAFNAEPDSFEFGLALVVADILRKRAIRDPQKLERDLKAI
jgi:hypothetical protein